MKHKNVKLSSLLLFGISLIRVYAQESITAAGGNAFSSSGSVSYSVGQVVYNTSTGATGSVAQGVQQTYEISVVDELEKIQGIDLIVSVYPNPTTDYLILKIKGELRTQYIASLYNLDDKLLEKRTIADKQTNFVVKNLTPATYFLKVMAGNKEVKIFKIIKK